MLQFVKCDSQNYFAQCASLEDPAKNINKMLQFVKCDNNKYFVQCASLEDPSKNNK